MRLTRRLLVLSLLFAVSACDRLSQRIWNCSAEPLPVTRILDTGERMDDIIPARSYIASMKGGVQIVALQRGGRVIWKRADATRGFAGARDDACEGRSDGLVAEQF